MYPKFTCSSRVEISIGNKQVFCSDVYISPQIRILLTKHFVVHWFNKRNTKIPPDFSKVLQYLQYNNTCIHNYYIQSVAMFVYISRFWWNVLTGLFYFPQYECCFWIKDKLVEINSVNVSYNKIFTLWISTWLFEGVIPLQNLRLIKQSIYHIIIRFFLVLNINITRIFISYNLVWIIWTLIEFFCSKGNR